VSQSLFGLAGVVAGVLLSTFFQRKHERERWYRDVRLEAYVRFLHERSAFFLPRKGPDGRFIAGDIDALANAFRSVVVVGADEPVGHARVLFGKALDGEEDPAVEWALVHAIRKDLRVPKLWEGRTTSPI
jgi:hypothetical protein